MKAFEHLFLCTDLKFIEGAKYAGADRVELYTEPYANMYNKNSQAAIKPFIEASLFANELGLGLNAGHDQVL